MVAGMGIVVWRLWRASSAPASVLEGAPECVIRLRLAAA
jgi:hypothetical protein